MALVAPKALDLIVSFEGYLKRLNDGTNRVRPYICPAGVPTIGYGSTRYFPGGRKVTMSDPPIDEPRARECLDGELATNVAAVRRLISRPLHPLMEGALVSFAYNCGNGALQGSTLRRVVNAGQWDRVRAEFAKWRMGGGRILPGLVRRRAAESALFLEGVRLIGPGGNSAPPVPPPAHHTAPPASPATPGTWARIFKWFFGG